ncbi:hypothetical protein [Citrobacter freundii]|uniref:Uncharacterized protein n=1 Tax=Citrobacter freundii TaxID=546 RepID=A0A7G2J096_CITFR|nr:hypothetical protein [Citrobacter freundii]
MQCQGRIRFRQSGELFIQYVFNTVDQFFSLFMLRRQSWMAAKFGQASDVGYRFVQRHGDRSLPIR